MAANGAPNNDLQIRTLQEENDWLRSVLRLAEAHIKHEKEELKSLNTILDRNKTDSEQRFLALEARMRATEKDKTDFDMRLHRERDQIRALEVALNEIRSKSTNTTDILQKAYADERVFLEHVRKLKSQFVGDRAMLEQELARVRQAVMSERQMREDAVRRENSILARYRATESTMLSASTSRIGGVLATPSQHSTSYVVSAGGPSGGDHLYM